MRTRFSIVAMDASVVEPGLPPYVLTRVFDPAHFNRILNELSDRPHCILLAQGHDVLEAGEGGARIRLAVEALPNVAIIDMGLPGMNGLDVAQRLRCHEATHHLYPIALSGYGQAEDKSPSMQAGFNLHLVKPFKADHISRVLAGLPTSERPPSGVG